MVDWTNFCQNQITIIIIIVLYAILIVVTCAYLCTVKRFKYLYGINILKLSILKYLSHVIIVLNNNREMHSFE